MCAHATKNFAAKRRSLSEPYENTLVVSRFLHDKHLPGMCEPCDVIDNNGKFIDRNSELSTRCL